MDVFLFILTVAMTIPTVMAADPVFSPITVTDPSGNSANRNSTITWGPLPSGSGYVSSNFVEGGLWGLRPLFNFAQSFINTVLPQEFPYDILLGMLNGSFNIANQYSELIPIGIGFIVCIVIGVLYIFIMPIIGCCICCCRCCCGNCGGAKKRENKDTDSCYCVVFSIILLVCALFTFVGCICVYVTNDNIQLAGLQTSLLTNIDNTVTYLDNTVAEFSHVVLNNYNFTVDVVNRDLDNIGSLLGVTTRDQLSANAGIDAALDTVLSLDAVIASVGVQLLAFNASVANIKSEGATLAAELASAKTDLDDANLRCGGAGSLCSNSLDTTVLALDVDFNNLPDISTQISQIVSVQSQNLSDNVLDGRREFDNIPQRVQNDTVTVVSSIKNLVSSFYTTASNALSPTTSLPAQLEGEITNIRDGINTYSATMLPYDKYIRYGGGIGLACFALIVVVLQIVALLLSCCGFNKDKDGHERTQVSDSAGRMYLASAGFVFIFTWFLMLLTVVFFLIGATLEKFVCQPLEDPNFTVFQKLFDEPPNGLFPNYVLGQALLQNGSIPLTISGVLRGCKNNGAVFSVFKLDSRIDLNQITNYRSSFDIRAEVNNINIDLSGITLLSPATATQLRDFSSASQLDYGGFTTELNKDTTQTPLDVYADNLRTIASGLSNPAKARFNNVARTIDGIHAGSFATVNSSQVQLVADVVQLNATTFNIPTQVNSTIDAVKAIDDYMANNASAFIKDQALSFGNRILYIFDQYVTETLAKIVNDVGRCRPIYNAYNSVISLTLCTYVVDTLNGLWFSIGWCILFETIGVIFAIKLAKFLLRMKPPNGHDEKLKPNAPPRNRVAPANDSDEWYM